MTLKFAALLLLLVPSTALHYRKIRRYPPERTVERRSMGVNKGSRSLVCPSCFASCEELAHCHWQCRNTKTDRCYGDYCISRLDSYTEDGFYMIRMGCTNRPPSGNMTSLNGPFRGSNVKDRPHNDYRHMPRRRGKDKEDRKNRKSGALQKHGWCYTSGSIDTPVEHCVCNSKDMCTLVDASAELDRPRIKKKTKVCCEVPSELYNPSWENSCLSECVGAHCITDFQSKRKQCGMDLADFHSDIRPDFDPSSLGADEQLCVKYEMDGEAFKLNRCVCNERFCNLKMKPPDYNQAKLPLIQCKSCRHEGPRDAVMDATTNWSCNNTCMGHYCVVSLQTSQVVQYYDEERFVASLPELEDDYYDFHAGCLLVNRPGIIRDDGCHAQWMSHDQPVTARCTCASTNCNDLRMMTSYVANAMFLPMDWWKYEEPDVPVEGSGVTATAGKKSTTKVPFDTTRTTRLPTTKLMTMENFKSTTPMETTKTATTFVMHTTSSTKLRTTPAPEIFKITPNHIITSGFKLLTSSEELDSTYSESYPAATTQKPFLEVDFTDFELFKTSLPHLPSKDSAQSTFDDNQRKPSTESLFKSTMWGDLDVTHRIRHRTRTGPYLPTPPSVIDSVDRKQTEKKFKPKDERRKPNSSEATVIDLAMIIMVFVGLFGP